VPRNVRLAEAPSHGQSIVGYDRASRGSVAYLGLAGEIIRRQAEREQTARTHTRRPCRRTPHERCQKRGLGRGLDALLGPKGATAIANPVETATAQPGDTCARWPSTCCSRKYQPRQEMDPAKLSELADSIKAQGVIQPIPRANWPRGNSRSSPASAAGALPPGRPERSAGGGARAGRPHRHRDGADREHPARRPQPLEEAQALERLIDEFSLTHAEAAEAVGRSRASVSNLLRLLELPIGVRVLLESRRLEMGHAARC
jgi:ParB family chromosome partitioning protein